MGHVDHGGAEFGVEPFEFRSHLHAELGVQVRERLVHQEHLGIADQCSAQRHPLLLTTRELPWLSFQQWGDAEDLGRLSYPLVEFDLGTFRIFSGKARFSYTLLFG